MPKIRLSGLFLRQDRVNVSMSAKKVEIQVEQIHLIMVREAIFRSIFLIQSNY